MGMTPRRLDITLVHRAYRIRVLGHHRLDGTAATGHVSTDSTVEAKVDRGIHVHGEVPEPAHVFPPEREEPLDQHKTPRHEGLGSDTGMAHEGVDRLGDRFAPRQALEVFGQ